MKDVTRYEATTEWGNAVMSEYKFGDFVTFEDYEALQQQLTATTNSLTNAQEALKSAGIEADTVQAGVMELVNKLAEETNRANQNAEYLEALTERMLAAEAQRDGLVAECMEMRSFIRKECFFLPKPLGEFEPVCDSDIPATPATDAYLNAVRAEAVEDAAKQLYGQGYNFEVLSRFADQLRAGNAGKDGSHE